MSSAFDDRTAPESSQRHPLESAPPPVSKRVDLSQMFTLIDGILPFEACLYYQVLPLSIEGSRLNLGMVDPNDRGAADYVRRILSYINCSIVSCQIPSDWHRTILSQYLSHTAKSKENAQITEKTSGGEANYSSAIDPPSQNKAAHSPISSATPVPSEAKEEEAQIIPNRPEEEKYNPENEADGALNEEPEQTLTTQYDLDQQNFRATLVVDTPEQLEIGEFDLEEHLSQNKSQSASLDDAEPAANAVSSEEMDTPPPIESNQSPLNIQVDSRSDLQAMEELTSLSPKAMMNELLKRVIMGGIGRLYFERQEDSGRILWSKDGVLQSVFENLQPSTIQAVIDELKRLTHLPDSPENKSKQVEIERLYQGKRVLLRFRTIPGKQGEEATLQILRGAALKFYQQQQIDKLSHNALGSAQKLQNQLNQIRERRRQSLNFSGIQTETLPAIFNLLKQMETQVQEILVDHSEQLDEEDQED